MLGYDFALSAWEPTSWRRFVVLLFGNTSGSHRKQGYNSLNSELSPSSPQFIFRVKMPIAPITGRLRKRLWLDLSVALGLGVASAYGFW